MNKAINLLKKLRDDYIHGELDKDINEAINELEALQSRSCDGCKYGKERYWDWDSGRHDKDVSFECKRLDKSNQLTPYSKHEENKFYCSPTFYCNRYEPKDNA